MKHQLSIAETLENCTAFSILRYSQAVIFNAMLPSVR